MSSLVPIALPPRQDNADLIVSVSELKLHCRVDHDVEDALIASYARTATQVIQAISRRQMLTAVYDLLLDGFPVQTDQNPLRIIDVPNPPLQSVSSIRYVDPAGSWQTMDPGGYQVETGGPDNVGRISAAPGLCWPLVRTQMNAVTVRFTCGYGLPADVPDEFKAAMRYLVNHQYEHREPVVIGQMPNEVQMTVESLLWQSRAYQFA